MINIFYAYSIVWVFILFLYGLGWSDMCTPLNSGLLVFLIFTIVISSILGFIFRKELKFQKMEKNTHKNCKVTAIIVLSFLIDFLYGRKIPLFFVMKGMLYNDVNFSGIPLIHNIIVTSAIFYSIYLSHIFFSFKDKKALIENIIIISFFVLLVQRQNILICILLFLNIGVGSILQKKGQIKHKKSKIILFIVLMATLLYLFGVFGNMRYGSKWSWNDSSMITTLGKQNDKYPEYIPNEYFWSYIYLVSPLSNLNYNVSNYKCNNDLFGFIMEFVPDFVRNRINYIPISSHLPVQSLNVSTAYVRPYLTYGLFGVYCIFLVEIILSIILTVMCYKKNKKYFMVVTNCLFYILIFMFFDNTLTYTTTSMLLVYCVVCSTGIKFKIK